MREEWCRILRDFVMDVFILNHQHHHVVQFGTKRLPGGKENQGESIRKSFCIIDFDPHDRLYSSFHIIFLNAYQDYSRHSNSTVRVLSKSIMIAGCGPRPNLTRLASRLGPSPSGPRTCVLVPYSHHRIESHFIRDGFARLSPYLRSGSRPSTPQAPDFPTNPLS
jgi:hypothetical protein